MSIPKLTREQAAIVGAYTGFAAGPFEDIQAIGDRLMGHPTWTHQYGDKEFMQRLKELVKPEFIALCADRTDAK